MRIFLVSAFCFFYLFEAVGQTDTSKTAKPDTTKKIQISEAACGLCQLDMKSKGCDLAIRMEGKTYFVDGTHIDAHGDAHAKDGFCNAIRKAEVQGEIIDNRFKVTYFKLIKPLEKKETN